MPPACRTLSRPFSSVQSALRDRSSPERPALDEICPDREGLGSEPPVSERGRPTRSVVAPAATNVVLNSERVASADEARRAQTTDEAQAIVATGAMLQSAGMET